MFRANHMGRLSRILAVFFIATFSLCGCMSQNYLPGLQVSVRREKPFVIVQSKSDLGFGFVSHPYLLAVSSNRLAMTYFVTGDPPGSTLAGADWPAFSDDSGKTWQFGDPFNWEGTVPTNLNHPTVLKQGELVKFFNMGYYFASAALSNNVRVVQYYVPKGQGPGRFTNLGLRSLDGGKTWSGPEVITYSTPTNVWTSHICLSPKAIQYSDGSLMCVGYVRFLSPTNSSATPRLRSSAVFRSLDEGRSYEYWGTIASPEDAPWGSEGPCEPSMEQLPNGDLVCLIRTQGGGFGRGVAKNMLLARSQDQGRTWKRNEMLAGGVMPGLLRLQNGILVAVYGLPGNCMKYSIDHGRTWSTEVAITPPDIRTSGYVDMVEVAPNRLLLVYDSYNAPLSRAWLWDPPDVVNAIWGMFVDITFYPWAIKPH